MGPVWTILPLRKRSTEISAKLIPDHTSAACMLPWCYSHSPAPPRGSSDGGCLWAVTTDLNAILYSLLTKNKQLAKHLLH